MPLTGYPKRTKYAPEDEVYILIDKRISPVVIFGWRTEVYDTDGDGTGDAVQETFYKFEGHGELEIIEREVFASENHALGFIKNDYFNRAIESGSGGSGFFQAGVNNNGDPRTFGNWTDLACWDLSHGQFHLTDAYYGDGTITVTHGSKVVTGVGTHFVSQAPTNTYLSGESVDGTVDFVSSETSLTLLEDQTLGSYSGTISTANGTAIITGVGTVFNNGSIQVGDRINATNINPSAVVVSIDSGTQITMNANSTGTASGLSYIIARPNKAYLIYPESPSEVTFLYESEGEKTLVFDGATLANATLPDAISDPADGWADFRDAVRSYDALTTVMPDGEKIGHPDDV